MIILSPSILAADFKNLGQQIADVDKAGEIAARFAARDALRGHRLRAELPDGTSIEGENLGVDSAGALLLSGPSGPVPVLAGSVFLS